MSEVRSGWEADSYAAQITSAAMAPPSPFRVLAENSAALMRGTAHAVGVRGRQFALATAISAPTHQSGHLNRAGCAALILPMSARHCPGETP